MPIAFTPRGPIFLVHVPKTGGTSMEDYLVRRFGPLALVDSNKREGVPGTGLIVAVNHLSAIDLREMIPQQSILVFAVVRDPLQRALSEYRWQKGASRMSRLSFSSWLRVMAGCLRIDARAYGNHLRPQDAMVPPEAEVVRLEDGFDGIIARIDTVTGSSAPGIVPGHFKRRGTDNAPIPVFRQDVTLTNRLYAEDYRRFGYAMPDPSDYPDDRGAALRDALGALLAPVVMRRQRRVWLR